MAFIRNFLVWFITTTLLAGQPAGGLYRAYRQPEVRPPDLANSGRIENLVRAGNLYLSLQDSIALALENNLDIAIQRYGPLQAESDLKRAQAGGFLRGSASGPVIPSLDPVVQGQVSYGHTTAPQTSSFLTGASTLVSRSKVANFSVSQNWLTGTTGTLTFNNGSLSQNSLTNNFNPYTSSSLDLLLTQHLLQGFGTALNNREIRVARNGVDASRLNFELQVINTVAAVSTLYWDLVSFNEQVKVAQSALDAARKLYEDNRKQVDVGYLAPISVVQAQAEVANRQQDLTVAETNVLQQETLLKNALSKNGTASPSLAEAHIVTTDHIQVPAIEPVEPVQDLIALALENRPDLKSSRINLDSARIRLVGSRNALLPTVDAFAEATNHGLAGQANSIATSGASGNSFYPTGTPDPYFIGGYGTALAQLFRRNFPDYRVGISVTIPLRNRAAQADYVRDHLDYDQSEVQLQKQVNQIRVDVQNGIIALRQSHARYQAAVQSRVLEEQTLDAEEKKYQAGVSTAYNLIQIQRDMANARGNEVAAESSYIRARTNLDTILGTTLQVNHVSIEEARRGAVSRPPDPIPVGGENGRNNQE
jgi:outer membrane protein TolC